MCRKGEISGYRGVEMEENAEGGGGGRNKGGGGVHMHPAPS